MLYNFCTWNNVVTERITVITVQGFIRKFPDWVDNEIYAYNNKYSLRNNMMGYDGKTH
jgi:hypothetical protein